MQQRMRERLQRRNDADQPSSIAPLLVFHKRPIVHREQNWL